MTRGADDPPVYLNIGQRVRIELEDGTKVWAVICGVNMDTELIDLTYGGAFGGEPDLYRKVVPGKRALTMTVEVEL